MFSGAHGREERAFTRVSGEPKGPSMNSDFWSQIGVMALTFGLAVVPALASRRMERSDYLTLIVIPPVTFVVAVLPGILIWGFTKDSATYVLGMLIVIVAATLNYRFQPTRRTSGPEQTVGATAGGAISSVKEA
jgi:prepilin signal peptidase PulO-like enzyme (type II secretory pathway)